MQNCSKLFLSKSSNPKMSRTPMDKHWRDRENRCYGGSSRGNTSLVMRALHLAKRSAVTALEPVIFEQEPHVLILCWVLRIVPCPVLFPGLGGTGLLPGTGCICLGSRRHRSSIHLCGTEGTVSPGPAWQVRRVGGTHRDGLFHVFLIEEGMVDA